MTGPDADSSALRCPYCDDYEVDRLYLASHRLDCCECASCGARWDQDARSGAYRGRVSRAWT